jgi:hypothetical protein
MPKFIAKIIRDDASDFKLIDGQDVNIRNAKDLTGATLVGGDLLLLDDINVSSSDTDGTEDSTGKVTLTQVKAFTDQTKADFDVDHLFTLVGAAADTAENLATFTGGTIADNQTIKQALQALETAVETKQASGNYITGTGSLSTQDLTDIGNLSGTNTGDNTVMSSANSYAAGLVPAGGATHNNTYLRKDGTWDTPIDTDTDTNTNQLTTFTLRDDDDDDFTIAHGKFLKVVSATGAAGTNIAGAGTDGDPWVLTVTSPNTTYSVGDGGLTTNDFTNDDHTKLNGIAAGAEVNVQADWNEADSGNDAFIQNKPNIAYTSAISAGNDGLVPSAGTSGHFLAHNGAFAQVAYSNLSGTPTIPTNYVTNNADDTMVGTLTINKDSAAVDNTSTYGQKIDLDHTGNPNVGQTILNYGLDIDVDYTGDNQGVYGQAPPNVNNFGINIALNSDAGSHNPFGNIDNTAIKAVLTGDIGTGDTTQIGYDLTITGGDVGSQTGILINTDNGSTDLKIVSSADTNDYFSISTGAVGETTIFTDDDGGEAANLILDIDGGIILDSHSGKFQARKAGTEFSASNSSYAGMILGYSRIANDQTASPSNIISLTGTMTVLQTSEGTDVKVTFVAPPSGNVEIQFSARLYTSSTTVGFALSDNATFQEVSETHTYDGGSHKMDETDIDVINVNWAVTGLTAGNSYTYFIAGVETSSTTSYIQHGRFRSTGKHYPPITVKAIALPAAILTGE